MTVGSILVTRKGRWSQKDKREVDGVTVQIWMELRIVKAAQFF